MDQKPKIKILKDGPYLVSGNVPLYEEVIVVDAEDTPVKWEKKSTFPQQDRYRLCRCGGSKQKPFCDGTHSAIKFDGTETAPRKNYMELQETTVGPELDLNDAEAYCAVACFCHRAGDTWTLTENSDDPGKKAIAIQEACDCPSGRLVAREKVTGEPIEPSFEPSISVVQTPHLKIGGPLWIKGGIPVEAADGYRYEVRNRVTLCCCGKSSNKPFCDGTHTKEEFNEQIS